MTAALALPWSLPALVLELRRRQPLLTAYGLATLALAIPFTLAQFTDPRLLHGIGIWVKPVKFLVSIGVFSLTMAWFFGHIRPERRDARPMRITIWVLVLSASFELLYIAFQAALGQDSHFNTATPFHASMYALMGLSAVLLVGTTLPLAWEIARRSTEGLRPDYRAAVVIGLLLTFMLGGGLGGYMSSGLGHSVGAEGGHVPLFGWNRSGGDLRIAHFLGIHAQQAIPVLAMLLTGLTVRMRWIGLAAGMAAYVALTLGLFAQAVAGRALLPL